MKFLRIWVVALLTLGQSLHASETLLPKAAATSPPAFLNQTIATADRKPPELLCPSVDYRKWQTWDDVGAALKNAPTCSMGQSWKPDSELLKEGATVSVAHFGQMLIIYAELKDKDIFNTGGAGSEKLYKSGDVFEVFLRRKSTSEYIEHHIAPGNREMQLKWSPAGTGSNTADTRKSFPGKVRVQSQVLIQPERNLWRILALVPLNELPGGKAEVGETNWYFSFGRYDYTKSESMEKPVVASTSPHKKRAFHTQSEWGRLKLAE